MEEIQERILIVDDSVVNNLLYTSILEDYDFIADSVNGGMQALNYLKRQIPDLILLDLMMPRMTGWDLLKIFQTDDKLTNIPVVIISAHIEANTKNRANLFGVIDVLEKPVSEKKLIETVNFALKAQLK